MKKILFIIGMFGTMSLHAQNNLQNGTNSSPTSIDWWVFLAFGLSLIFLIGIFNIIINALDAMKKFYTERVVIQQKRVLNPDLPIGLPEYHESSLMEMQ